MTGPASTGMHCTPPLLLGPRRGSAPDLSGSGVVMVAAEHVSPCGLVAAVLRELVDERVRAWSAAPDSSAEVVADTADVAAVSLGRPLLADPVRRERVPLLMIRTAARYGWSLGRLHDRLTRFAGLLPHPVPELDGDLRERMPDWRDPVLVTAGLDGRHPLTAEVLAEGWFVDRAARALDLPAAGVVARLRAYAGLCGYPAP